MSEIKLGVQLFTLRDKCQNAEDFETTLKFLDSIGCNVIQISAIGDIHPEIVGELVDKYKMDVCVTHKPYDRMKNDLDALISEIIKGAGYTCHKGGNIGIPLFTKLNEINQEDIIVLELSSFQLMGMEVSPDISVITNITPNHLNWHKDMQEYTFIPNLGIEPKDFWGEANLLRENYKMDQVLTYMYLMFKKTVESNRSLKRDYLNEMGRNIELFPGVIDWFDRITEYGRSLGVEIEHYIISAGLKEIIEGKHDDLPEQAFYMVGTIEEAIEKAKTLQ